MKRIQEGIVAAILKIISTHLCFIEDLKDFLITSSCTAVLLKLINAAPPPLQFDIANHLYYGDPL